MAPSTREPSTLNPGTGTFATRRVAIVAIALLGAWFAVFTVARPLPFFSYFHDPELTYILNARELLATGSVEHTDHPGTILQLVGAGLHLVLGTEIDEVLAETAINPFRALWAWLSLLSAIALILLAARHFREGWVLVVGLGLLVFDPNAAIYWTRFTPEGGLFALYLPFALLALMRFTRGDRVGVGQAIAWGILLGALTTLKITFWPLTLFLAFVLLATRDPLDRRAVVCAGAFFVAALATYLPLGSLFARDVAAQWAWLGRLITHSGRYGSGEEGVLSLSEILRWTQRGYASQGYFPLLVLAVFAALASWDLFGRARGRRSRLLALGVLLCFALSVLLFAKHPYQIKYLLPLAPLLFLYWSARREEGTPPWPRLAKLGLVALLGGVGINALATYAALHEFTLRRHQDTVAEVDKALEIARPRHALFSYEIQHPLAARAFAVNETQFFLPQLESFAIEPSWFRERQSDYALASGTPFPQETLPPDSLIFTASYFEDPRAQLVYANPDLGFGLFIYQVAPTP